MSVDTFFSKKQYKKFGKKFFETTYLVKYILELVLRQSTALDVFNRAEVLCHTLTVLSADWGHLLLGKLLSDAGVISQIDLGSDNEAGNAGAVVVNLGEPLLANVFE
jgi:hypothetical protein